MDNMAPVLSVWVEARDSTAWIKVTGRASFTWSVGFKDLVLRLCDVGYTRFVLDLSACLLMDSTFLGVLAGLGSKFHQPAPGGQQAWIELLNPNPRVLDLLDNLGVAHLFHVRTGASPATDQLRHLEQPQEAADPVALARASLEAHQTLMNLNPANVPKFKDVAEFLAEDLKKLEAQRPTPPTPPGDANKTP
jgi:anti-anti-sigma regulatory factor